MMILGMGKKEGKDGGGRDAIDEQAAKKQKQKQKKKTRDFNLRKQWAIKSFLGIKLFT